MGLKPVQEVAPKVSQTASSCEGHLGARWLEVNSGVQTVDTTMLPCVLLGKYESTEEGNDSQVSKESENMLKDN